MINGDDVNGIWNRIAYFPQCISAATKGNARYAEQINLELEIIENQFLLGSPSRQLSHMFWETIDWEKLSYSLKNKINILDIACGAGHYGYRYKRLSKEWFDNYTGLDIYRDEHFPNEFNHIIDNAENAYLHIKNHNLICSQSGLEHIEYDFVVLDRITNILCKNKKPFVQVHLVPAFASLFLYLWHGWRQYSKKNLGTISKLLRNSHNVNIKIIPIGGWRSFYSHMRYITIPNFLSTIIRRPNDWNIEGSKSLAKIRASVFHDRNSKGKIPSFWAVVISSKDITVENLFKK